MAILLSTTGCISLIYSSPIRSLREKNNSDIRMVIIHYGSDHHHAFFREWVSMDAGYGSFNNSVASGKWEQRNNQNVDLFYFDNCSDCSLFFFSSPYWKDFFSLRHFAITDYRMEFWTIMQKFLSLLFSRRALAVVGVVMLALLVRERSSEVHFLY